MYNKRRKKKRVIKKYKRIIFMFAMAIIGIMTINKVFTNGSESQSVTTVSKSMASRMALNEDVFTVCIDPGHGDWDVGAIGISGSYEKDIALDVALLAGEMLEAEGINVVYTRTTDDLTWSDNSTENLYERVNISKENNSDLFISIHCNSAYDSEYNGVETWYNSKSEDSEVFASIIQSELSSIGYTYDRGIKFYSEDEPLAVLNNSDVPAALIELGFISNWDDEDYLTSEYGQALVAEGIYKAVLEYKSKIEN